MGCIDRPNCISLRRSRITLMPSPAASASSSAAVSIKEENQQESSSSLTGDSFIKEESQQESSSSLTGDSFIRPNLRKLSAYQPILPFEVLSTRLARKPEDIIKLDANENPYGPPPEVFEALGSMRFPYIYPDPESRRLRAALANDSGIEAEYILAGCGADELIDLIMRCVLEPGEKILDCPPTFTMYESDAAFNGALVVKVPRKADFSLDVEQISDVVEREKGSIIDDKVLLELLDLPLLVVLDEFSGTESKMSLVKKFENRTSSERAALAGLRVGRAKQSYNVSAAELAACKALENPIYLEDVNVFMVQVREGHFKISKEVPFLNPYLSYSNFILREVTTGRDAKKLKLSSFSIIVMSPGRFRVLPVVAAEFVDVYVEADASPLTEAYALWLCEQHPLLRYCNRRNPPVPFQEWHEGVNILRFFAEWREAVIQGRFIEAAVDDDVEELETRAARTREVREYYIRNTYTLVKLLLAATACVAVGTTCVAVRNVQVSACSFFSDSATSVDRFFVNSEEHVKKLFHKGIFRAIFCTN